MAIARYLSSGDSEEIEIQIYKTPPGGCNARHHCGADDGPASATSKRMVGL